MRHPDADEVVLIVEASNASYWLDRGKKWDANARSSIPVFWIVNLPRRGVEVYTEPSPDGYKSRRDYHPGDAIPVVIDGRTLGQIAVDSILPRRLIRCRSGFPAIPGTMPSTGFDYATQRWTGQLVMVRSSREPFSIRGRFIIVDQMCKIHTFITTNWHFLT